MAAKNECLCRLKLQPQVLRYLSMTSTVCLHSSLYIWQNTKNLKKLFFVTIAAMISSASFAQYWQQQVNYKINVSLNDQANTLKGLEELEYINNSPDKLDFIWFHFFENAYKNDSTAFAKQVLREK